jgi:hypothetical protein
MDYGTTTALLDRLAALRTELVDVAYDLDVRGARAAADLAMTTSARLAELCAEFSAQPSAAPSGEIAMSLSDPGQLIR